MTPTWHVSKTSAGPGRGCSRDAAASWNVDKICESFIGNAAFGLIIGDPRRNAPGANHERHPAARHMNQFDKKSEAWSALFSEPMSELVKRYTASVFVRQAHVGGGHSRVDRARRMLAKQGVITEADRRRDRGGPGQIYREIEAGTFVWDLADEDVHMAIERVLTERIGPAGARLHTGRSRNDQVATDTRLYAKSASADLGLRVLGLRVVLVRLAEEHSASSCPATRTCRRRSRCC